MVAYSNGIMTRFLYRSDNFRLLRLKSEKYTKAGLTYSSNSGVKQNYSYEYDLSGNIINISDTTADCGYGATPNAISRDFIYDALYRLLSATGRETAATGTTPWDDLYRPENESLARGYTQQYEYDKLGNIHELQHIATSGNFTRTFGYDPLLTNNALQKITIGSNVYNFSYDVNGNMLSEGDTARHLEYDCADLLRAFFVQTGTAEPSKYTHYLYDGGGNRVKKITRTQGGGYTATTYIDGAFEYTKESNGFDGIPNLAVGTWTIGVYSSGGEQNILHIMGGSTRRIGAALGDTTPAIKYNLDDHLGSSCVQLDINGTTVSVEEYYPFGETSFGSYAKKRYRFCGKEKDEESGLYYYGARYYSPWTCRFISIDPMAGKYPMKTPYHYCSNNPINKTDPTGMDDGDPPKEPAKAPDGTGTNDGVGVDIVKINGVDYATWKEKDGTIKSQPLNQYGITQKDLYPLKNTPNQETRNQVGAYWKDVEAKQLEIQNQQLEQLKQQEEAVKAQQEAEQKAVQKTEDQKIKQQSVQKNSGENKNPNAQSGENSQPPPENDTTTKEEFKITQGDVLDTLEKASHDAIVNEQMRAKKQLVETLNKSNLKNKVSGRLADLMMNLKKVTSALRNFDIFSFVKDVVNGLISILQAALDPVYKKVKQAVEDVIEPFIEFALGRYLIFDTLVTGAMYLLKQIPVYNIMIDFLTKLFVPTK